MEPDNQFFYFLFINTKSGGGLGRSYLTLQNRRLKFKNKSSIAFVYLYDMCSQENRKIGFGQVDNFLKENKKINIIICGGDGTILWVIQQLIFFGINVDKINFGVIPIGTGNDFSRSIGWGGDPISFRDGDIKELKSIVKKWLKAQVKSFDIWQTQIRTYQDGKILLARQDQSAKGMPNLKRNFSNYLGIGIDARVSYRVQKNRTQSKFLNLVIYGCLGCCGFLKGSEKMDEIVDEFSESDSEREDSYNDSILTMATEERRKKRLIESEEQTLTFKKGYKGLICQNCTSYMAGVQNVWRTRKSAVKQKPTEQFSEQRFDDGKVQFVAFKNEMKLGLQRFINSGAKVTQGQGPYIVSFKSQERQTYIQIDGEAMKVQKLRDIIIRKSPLVPNSQIKVLINKGD